MLNQADLDFGDFVERLYGSVLDSADDWTPVLEPLTRFVGGTHAHFYAGQPSEPSSPRIRSFYGAGLDQFDSFLDTYGKSDPRMPRFMTSRGRVVLDPDVEPPDFDEHPIVREFLDPFQVRRMVGMTWSPDGDQLAIAGVLRSRERGYFGAMEAQRFEASSAHLLRAFDLHRHMIETRALRQSITEMLTASPRAAILLDRRGRTLLANEAAEALARQELLSGLAGTLSFPDPDAVRALGAALAEARGVVSGGGPTRLFLVRCTRPGSDALRRLIGRVVPIPSSHPFRITISPRAAAAVYLSEIDAHQFDARAFHPGLFSSVFGLSPHEARLAVHLGSGLSLDDASAAFGVSRNTVRVQLQSIFSKTETSRQAELVHLVQRVASLCH